MNLTDLASKEAQLAVVDVTRRSSPAAGPAVIALLAAFACRGPDDPLVSRPTPSPTGPPGDSAGATSIEDSGTATTSSEGCVDTGPCSSDLAAATWNDGPNYGWTGYRVQPGNIAGTQIVVVASPIPPHAASQAAVLSESGLTELGTWVDRDPTGTAGFSQFGECIAFSPTGERVAIGASSGAQTYLQEGALYVFDALPAGNVDVADVATLTIFGDISSHFSFAQDVDYLDLTGNGVDLVVGSGNADPGTPNDIYRFDPWLEGEFGVEVATAAISGEPILGQQVVGWDGDRDGLDELVTSTEDGAAHFDTPWIGDLTQDDADLHILESDPLDQLGTVIANTGDLDGDGAAELAITADTYYGADVARGGGLWLANELPMADVLGADLPFAFLGTDVGDAMGSGVAAGDWDGDGNRDLATGVMGLVPGVLAGKVCVWLGPLSPAARTCGDADLVIHGQNAYDGFGRDLAASPSLDQGQDDLVVGAFQWEGTGRVYLFHGADLFP